MHSVADAYHAGDGLLIVDCPYCGHAHWHMIAGSRLRLANCERKNLPKRLRDKPLKYWLHFVRNVYEPLPGEVIAFQ